MLDFLNTLLLFCGVWIGWKGLGTWHDQIRGTSRFEHARLVLEAILRLRKHVNAFRNVMLRDELQAAREERGDADPRWDRTENQQLLAYLVRWDAVARAWEELDERLLAADGVLGAVVRLEVGELEQRVKELKAALLRLRDARARGGPGPDPATWEILFASVEGDDAYSSAFETAVTDALAPLRRVLETRA